MSGAGALMWPARRTFPISRTVPRSSRRWRPHLEQPPWQHRSTYRSYSDKQASKTKPRKEETIGTKEEAKFEQGAMARRLEEMSEEALTSSPRQARKLVEEAGFSAELKHQLERRIATSKVGSEHPQALSMVSMPAGASKDTRETAEARPWTGSEKLEDTALRMLEDAHKPLRGSAGRRMTKLPPIDTRMRQTGKSSTGQRLANARDKSSIYTLGQDNSMSEKEKQEMRQMLKERFQPGARSIPATIQGLQSLASERIEDAIARGLFKNIPRGKGVNVERDYAASSPFLDTTEYFMNKIIQKQEVLPPWVEKQQEVTRTIATFRARLRNDWKRHAARMIASKGGTLEQQVRRAELNAQAEAAANPRAIKQETVSSVDIQGNLTRVTVSQTPAEQATDAQSKITVTEESTLQPPQSDASETVDDLKTTASASTTDPSAIIATPESVTTATKPLPPPFRDPDWEKTELSYHTLALTSLNNLTRSYNLMAPELAKKPYFSLVRELRNCYSDVAPLLAQEIVDRARSPVDKARQFEGHRQGGVLERFSANEKVRVWESRRPQYGFKEFWKDVWTRAKKNKQQA